jgi:ABC-2 type transport system ATP-binding protein
MPPAVLVEDLRKRYGSFEAVRGVDFEVGAGEVVAVLGPNGAGKTSTVEILEGYRRRDGGRVEVLGTDPQGGGRAWRDRIGVVLQDGGVLPEVTVAEVLSAFRSYYSRPRDLDEVLVLVGLVEQRGSRVRQLSGGQRRRLDLALALVGRPALLFLDEPTTGFDPAARRDAWSLIAGLRDDGVSVLLTTHYMEEAQRLADRIVVLARGRVVADGTVETLAKQASDSACISFRLPPGVRVGDLPVRARHDGTGGCEIATARPTSVLRRLTAWCVERRIELPELRVARPTLEDVYLRLTGEAADDGD